MKRIKSASSKLLKKLSNKPLQLFLTSTTVLYLELVVIRWLASEVRIFAFLKNIPLMICFLGLGLGLLSKTPHISVRKRLPLILFLLLVSLTLVSKTFIANVPIPTYEDLWVWQTSERFLATLFQSSVSVIISLYFLYILIITYFLTLIFMVFFALGEILKGKMSVFKPLSSYSYDLLGSIFGVILFTATSFLETNPAVWISISFLILYLVIKPNKIIVLSGIILLVLIYILTNKTYWSPYYKISLHRSENSTQNNNISLGVNQVYFQRMVDLSDESINDNTDPEIADFSVNYNLPYWLINNPGEVLIVGSGTGNDVAAALRHNAVSVDAVEIDPVILKLGTELHPEKPYSDKRVHAIVDDARSYFEKTDKKYDTIVYGLLDSHTSTSTFSNIRLDNFVYTKESFSAAKKHLKNSGSIIVSFAAGKPWILSRIDQMLTEVFGKYPLIYKRHINAEGAIFVISNNINQESLNATTVKNRQITLNTKENNIIPTDDWPYLYLKTKSIPILFLFTLLVVILLFGIYSYFFLGKNILKRVLIFDNERWHFFFLGVAFLLIEIKSINELSLLFGSTWIVNSAVILGILVMAYLANYIVKKGINFTPTIIVIGLFGSLLYGYLIQVSDLAGKPFLIKFVEGGIISALPLFFSGLLFSYSFRKTKNLTEVFGANMFGAFIGGIVENIGMITGIRNLAFFATTFYILAIYFAVRAQPKKVTKTQK